MCNIVKSVFEYFEYTFITQNSYHSVNNLVENDIQPMTREIHVGSTWEELVLRVSHTAPAPEYLLHLLLHLLLSSVAHH